MDELALRAEIIATALAMNATRPQSRHLRQRQCALRGRLSRHAERALAYESTRS